MREQTKQAGNVGKEAFEEPALCIVLALGDSLMRHARVPCAFSVYYPNDDIHETYVMMMNSDRWMAECEYL